MGHEILQITKGVQIVPGTTTNAEVGLDTINFLDTSGGFSVDAYEMKMPAMKSSAVYADSPLSDGRTLISGALGNVSETIRVTLQAGTLIQLAAMLTKLNRFKQDCNDYWDSGCQIEPVYIKHQVSGEAGPRFALLIDIDIAIEAPTNPSDPTRDLTIVIERLLGWHGLAPGDNPKRWAIENVYGLNYNSGNSNLDVPQAIDSQYNLIYASTLVNRVEYSTVNKQTYVTKNFIDIPAAKVPGDLPALACVYFFVGSSAPPGNHIVFVSRKSTRADHVVPSVDVFLQSMMLNACDMALGANMTLAADTGAPLSQALGARRRAVFTPADNVDAVRLTVASRATLNHRGRYAVFCRCRQAAGAAGDISMYLAYGSAVPFGHRNVTTPVTPTLQAGTGNTTYWPVTYMGVIETPINAPATSFLDGVGVMYAASDWYFQLYARRTAGTTALLYVADFVLIPLDEPSMQVISSNTATGMDGVIDNTGYFQHGKPDLFVDSVGGSAVVNATEPRGQAIYLLPGVNQRLYFFSMFSDNTSDLINDGFAVGLNIIPRWSGLRDAAYGL